MVGDADSVGSVQYNMVGNLHMFISSKDFAKFLRLIEYYLGSLVQKAIYSRVSL